MPTINKVKQTTTNESTTNAEKSNEEAFNRALKNFQKVSQETKREFKKHEYYISPKVEMRAKRSAASKNKRRK